PCGAHRPPPTRFPYTTLFRSLDHAADVDPGRSAALVERRDPETRMLADADLLDLAGGCHRFSHASSSDESRDGRRGRHGATAEPDRLDDRAVAHVRVGVVAGEAGKVEADGRVHRGREPAVAERRDTN